MRGRFPLIAALVLPALGVAAGGCHTPFGNYFANRARDLGECVRVEVGAGVGLGASVQAAGLAHFGLAGSVNRRSHGLGWVYGDGYAFGAGVRPHDWEAEVDLSAPVVALSGLVIVVGLLAVVNNPSALGGDDSPPSPKKEQDDDTDTYGAHWRIAAADEWRLHPRHAYRRSFFLLPAVLTQVGPEPGRGPPPSRDDTLAWLWGERARAVNPWAHVHAFDIEASVYAGLHVRVGFSPGEFLDFLTGWFGADIAGDDR